MNVLSLDFSGDVARIGLLLRCDSYSGEGEFFEAPGMLSSNVGREMFPNIQAVCKMGGIRPNEIHLMGVNRGPGRFSGIRMAVSCSRGFGRFLQIPIVALDTFEILRFQSEEWRKSKNFATDLPIVLVADGFGKNIFVSVEKLNASNISSNVLDVGVEDFISFLYELYGVDFACALIGGGAMKHRALFHKAFANVVIPSESEVFEPQIRVQLNLCLQKQRQNHVQNIDFLVPYYVRHPVRRGIAQNKKEKQ